MFLWAFALDHINFTHWMLVFICNLKSLHGNYVYNEFCEGHFTVKKLNLHFPTLVKTTLMSKITRS